MKLVGHAVERWRILFQQWCNSVKADSDPFHFPLKQFVGQSQENCRKFLLRVISNEYFLIEPVSAKVNNFLCMNEKQMRYLFHWGWGCIKMLEAFLERRLGLPISTNSPEKICISDQKFYLPVISFPDFFLTGLRRKVRKYMKNTQFYFSERKKLDSTLILWKGRFLMIGLRMQFT